MAASNGGCCSNFSAPIVLVTGASGYVGSRIVSELLQVRSSEQRASYRVRAAVRGSVMSEKYDNLRRVGMRACADLREANELLELVSLDLNQDEGWQSAVDGCEYVLHLASPFPLTAPSNADEAVVKPAVEGTRRLMEACSRSHVLKRLVFTSSVAAVSGGGDPSRAHQPSHHIFTEDDWPDPDLCPPYELSKTLAERKAWELWNSMPETSRFEMVVLNPTLVIGPLLYANPSPSVTLILKMFSGKYPAIPCLYPNMVDIRDIAQVHIKAMTLSGLSGERYIISSEVEPVKSLPELAAVISDRFRSKGYRVSTYSLPWWVCSPMRLIYPEMKLAYPFVDVHCYYNVHKAAVDFGMDFIPVSTSILDMVQTFEDLGMIKPRRAPDSRPQQQSTASRAEHRTDQGTDTSEAGRLSWDTYVPHYLDIRPMP